MLGKIPQTSHQLLQGFGAENPRSARAPFGKGNGQAVERQQLTQEGLGGGNTHLDAGADVEDLINHPAQGAFRAVRDPQQTGGEGRIGNGSAPLLLHRESSQGVCRFTRLGHTDGEGVRRQRWRGVAEFAGIEHAGRNPGQLLQEIGPHQGGMAAGAAGEHLNALNPFKHALIERQGHPRG